MVSAVLVLILPSADGGVVPIEGVESCLSCDAVVGAASGLCSIGRGLVAKVAGESLPVS